MTLDTLGAHAVLQRRLEEAFPPAFPHAAEPEKTIHWLADNIHRGLTRIYAVNVDECSGAKQHQCLLEKIRQRIEDAELIHQLEKILQTPAQAGDCRREALAPLLAGIAFEGIDQILQQAKTLGREDNFLHVQCVRVENELVVLVDRDPRYEWILPAVQKRLREELANLHYAPAAIESQSLDLSCGHRLRFLNYELRLVKDRHGEARARYRLVEKAKRRLPKNPSTRWPLSGRYRPLHFVHACLNWSGPQPLWQSIRYVCRKVNSIQVGWRHLPITLSPIVALLFGWRSPATWLCLSSIFACNWRWPLAVIRMAGVWAVRNKLDSTMAACALMGLICLYPLASEFYANLSRAEAAPFMPPGFYLCQYNKGSPFDAELVSYGLYVPPHFEKEKGPFPLIVFLHGYGERTKKKLFKAGLPVSIAGKFGPNKPSGPFDFVAFFPIDPTGKWETESAEVKDVLMALDHVIGQYRIDPARVYLTGISNGGIGVWRLAEAYPDKWAAVVPVSSFISPDVQTVRHIPAWIFHGADDKWAPVKQQRTLLQQLQEAGADVCYTEIPDKGHFIWDDVYNSKDLYNWLASKKKR